MKKKVEWKEIRRKIYEKEKKIGGIEKRNYE
jgi:hypothetical protein